MAQHYEPYYQNIGQQTTLPETLRSHFGSGPGERFRYSSLQLWSCSAEAHMATPEMTGEILMSAAETIGHQGSWGSILLIYGIGVLGATTISQAITVTRDMAACSGCCSVRRPPLRRRPAGIGRERS